MLVPKETSWNDKRFNSSGTYGVRMQRWLKVVPLPSHSVGYKARIVDWQQLVSLAIKAIGSVLDSDAPTLWRLLGD